MNIICKLIPTVGLRLCLRSLFLWVCLTTIEALADEAKLFPVVETRLTNGLRILTLEDHHCPIVAVQVWYHVGSADEPELKQGFAHLFEHLMFRGTDRLGPTDHFDLIQSVGGHCNAHTEFDTTVYENSLPAQQLELALWLESERMGFLTVDATGFNTERKVVEEELRMYLNNPYGDLQAPGLAAIFGNGVYAHSPAGSIHDLRLATPADVHEWWKRWYVPNNATLVVVGDVQAANVQTLAEKYFGWIPPVPQAERHITNAAPYEAAKSVTLKSQNAPAPLSAFVWRTVPEGNPDSLPLELAGTILGGGESSRLHRKLVNDDKLAVEAMAVPFGLERGGIFAAAAVQSPLGGDAAKAKAAIQGELERLRKDGVTAEELEKARNQAVNELVIGAETDEGKAALIGQAAVKGAGLDELNARLDRLRHLTREDLQKAVNTYLDPQRALTVNVPSSGLLDQLGKMLLGAPKKTDDIAPVSFDTNIVLRGRPGVVRPADLPLHAPVAEGNSPMPTPDVREHRLANGLRVLIAPRTNTPAVNIILALPFGSCVETKNGAASMTMALLTKGTAKHDEKSMTEELGRYAIEMSGSADVDDSSLTARCLNENAERAMSLLAEAATTPTFPEDAFKTAVTQTATGLAVSDSTPASVVGREFRHYLYPGHAYGREVSGDAADVAALRRDDLVAHWKRVARPESAALIITGDLPEEKAIALSEKFFSAWKSQDESEITVAPPPKYSEGTRILLVDWPGAGQSEIRAGCPGMTATDTNLPVAKLVGEYFGGSFGGRLNKAIRVANGGTYGAQGGFNAGRLAGSFVVHTFTKTPSTADTLRMVLAQIQELTNRPPDKAELAQSQRYFLGSAAARLETSEQEAGEIERDVLSGLPLDNMQRTFKIIAGSDAAACQALIHRYVDANQLLIVVVGDASKIANDLQSIAPVIILDKSGKPKPPAKPKEAPDSR